MKNPRRPGRPRKPAVRLQRRSVHISLTDAEYHRVARLAEARGLALASWARELLIEALRRPHGAHDAGR